MQNKCTFLLCLICLLFLACSGTKKQPEANSGTVAKAKKISTKLPLDKIKLPEGFKIEVFAEGLKNARSLALSDAGTLYVGTRNKGKVYAVKNNQQYVLAKGLNMPNGVALRNGDLYVAEVNRILKFADIENNLNTPPEPIVINDSYPDERHHGWKFIAFGPDDKLYVPVGAPCNICESEEIFSSLTRINPDGSGFEIVQHGIRNTVGFTWHPETKELWFTENGRDWMGDDLPACELNHAPTDGLHFGYPYCHQGNVPDPEFGNKRDCKEFVKPVQNLGPHVAPLGMEFIPGKMFGTEYEGHILIAEHGSWNRSKAIGYRVMLVKLEGNKATSYEVFAEGWLEDQTPWGRPVDLEFMPDGSLLLSDDFAGVVYRIWR